jgi:hypothetical protein
MKTAIGGSLLALALFAVAWLCHAEAGFTRRLASAQEHLATLRYQEDAAPGEEPAPVRVLLPAVSLAAEARRHQARLAYWRAAYQQLMPAGDKTRATDPQIMLIGANAAFRAALGSAADKLPAAERLDPVVQAYAEVLRADPGNADAAYNYEYVARFRDASAKRSAAKPGKMPSPDATTPPTISLDLPGGPTVHGWPGSPPPTGQMQKFKTVVPMRSNERKELTPGLGPEMKRRG